MQIQNDIILEKLHNAYKSLVQLTKTAIKKIKDEIQSKA